MDTHSEQKPFDENNFSSGAYAGVSFSYFNQYWWANRYLTHLARRFGPTLGKVLEVGCGMGDLHRFLESDHTVFGIDITLFALAQARKKLLKDGYVLVSVEDPCVI